MFYRTSFKHNRSLNVIKYLFEDIIKDFNYSKYTSALFFVACKLCIYNSREIVQYLILKKGDLNMKTDKGNTILHYLVDSKKIKFENFKFLVKKNK